MEYITETRGGYDEWSDKREAIVGLRLDNGTEIRTRQINNWLTDENENNVEIELPLQRTHQYMNITVERYEPEYEIWEFNSLSEFEQSIDIENETFNPN
jgi:hypothetical protein